MANSHANAAIVIPARLRSTRLPEKLLLRDTGKSVLRHTFEAACQSYLANRILIATDHQRIVEEVASFTDELSQRSAPLAAVMTDPNAASGTDRVAQVAEQLPEAEIIVNVQGDEPELDAAHIDLAIQLLLDDPTANMSTLAAPITSDAQWHDPNCVKVVADENGRALYFSRAAIPHARDGGTFADVGALQHIGLYAYRRDFLLKLATLPSSRLENIERLEQLRVLESGHTIRLGIVPHANGGIDTLEDYVAFVERQRVRV